MKKIRKTFFLLLIFIGFVKSVSALDDYSVQVDNSILIKDGTLCESYNENTISFEVKGLGCIVTGVKEGELKVLKEGAVVGNNPIATGIVMSRIYIDGPLERDIEMADFVRIINNGYYTKEVLLKSDEYDITSVKAGFVDNKLYINIAGDNNNEVVVYDYNPTTRKITYEETTKDGVLAGAASITGLGLFMWAMESSPNFEKALNLMSSDTDGENAVIIDVLEKYLNLDISFEGNESDGESRIKIEFLLSSKINEDIIKAYNLKQLGGESNGGNSQDIDNPKTGAYVNYVLGLVLFCLIIFILKISKQNTKFNRI